MAKAPVTTQILTPESSSLNFVYASESTPANAPDASAPASGMSDVSVTGALTGPQTQLSLPRRAQPGPRSRSSRKSENENENGTASESGAGAPLDKVSRWTAQDDVTLAGALVAQKNRGRARKAVFTPEAWMEVAAKLEGSEHVSGGAAKTVTQCKARWQRLKIEYRIIRHLRSTTGFSWDEQTQMVTASPEDWTVYIAEHRDAQPWRKKSFPVYECVRFLLEDENGNEYGENGHYKRRWKSKDAENDIPGPSKGSAMRIAPSPFEDGSTPHMAVSPSTGVFSLSPHSSMGVPVHSPVLSLGVVSYDTDGHAHRYEAANGKDKRLHSPPDQPHSKRRRASQSPPPASSSVYTSYTNGYTPPTYPSSAYCSPIPPSHVTTPMILPTAEGVGMTSPLTAQTSSHTRMMMAIQRVEESEGLSEDELVRAVQLFQRRPEVGDAYLAIRNQRARSLYLRAEIEDFARSVGLTGVSAPSAQSGT